MSKSISTLHFNRLAEQTSPHEAWPARLTFHSPSTSAISTAFSACIERWCSQHFCFSISLYFWRLTASTRCLLFDRMLFPIDIDHQSHCTWCTGGRDLDVTNTSRVQIAKTKRANAKESEESSKRFSSVLLYRQDSSSAAYSVRSLCILVTQETGKFQPPFLCVPRIFNEALCATSTAFKSPQPPRVLVAHNNRRWETS